jgi:hypothetical protein
MNVHKNKAVIRVIDGIKQQIHINWLREWVGASLIH